MEKTQMELAREYISKAIALIGFVLVYDIVSNEFNKRVAVKFTKFFF